MCPSPQCLPTELIDTIIDEAAVFKSSDKWMRSHILLGLALTSHAFRRRVCKHIFQEIFIHDISQVYSLADLLNTKLWPEDEQLDAYIRDVSIILVDSYPELYAVVNGRDMRRILNRIFRRYPRDQAPAFYFCWNVQVYSDSHRSPWDWSNCKDRMRHAFLSMLQNSSLTELVIFSSNNVPRDIVLGSRIPIFQFGTVKFALPSDQDKSAEGILDSWHLENITKFTTDHTISPIDYIGTIAYHASPSTPIFQNLKKLICCICNDEEYEMTVGLMQRATMLETLSISLPEPMNGWKHLKLSYNHLLNLKVLIITYYNPLRPLAPNYPELVQNVVDFFMPTIPSIRNLSLFFSIMSMNNHSTDLEKIFARHDFSAIDDFFANSLPPSVKYLGIHIDVVVSTDDKRQFLADGMENKIWTYARGLFPRLSTLPCFFLSTKAFVCLGVLNRWHYSSYPGYNWEFPRGILYR